MSEEQVQEVNTTDNEIENLKKALRQVSNALVDLASQINKVAQ